MLSPEEIVRCIMSAVFATAVVLLGIGLAVGAVIGVWATKPAAVSPSDAPAGPAMYTVTCSGCGTVFTSTSPGPVDSCPNCPLDICPETAGLILTIGPLAELVRHQPDNQQAKRQLAAAEAKLKAHCDTCEKCRKALGIN